MIVNQILRAINISQLSERTREMHKELVRVCCLTNIFRTTVYLLFLMPLSQNLYCVLAQALSFHACLPILNVTATTITTIMLMDIIRHPALENVVFIVSLMFAGNILHKNNNYNNMKIFRKTNEI